MKLLGYIFLGFLAFVVTIGVLLPLGSILTAPGRVLTKTLQTDNIINNYEWYFDVNAQYETRMAQIKQHQALLNSTTDTNERSRINLELGAMQFTCRDLANRYNANAMKLNRTLFRDWRLPENLLATNC